MKKFICITLLCITTICTTILPMKRLLDESPANKSLESWCTTKLYEYHSPEKQHKPFERSNSDLNLWGSPRKDSNHTEDYDMNCLSSIIAENTELDHNYDKTVRQSSFSIAFEKIMTSATITNTEDIESEENFFQPSSDYTTNAIALYLPTQIRTNTENTKSVTNTDTETESETDREEDLYQPTFAYSEKDVEPTQTKTITKFFCTTEGCSKVFTAQNHLDKHMTRHTNLSTQYHTCTFDGCNEFFATEYGLNIHISKLHSKKNYNCTFEECNKSFEYKHNLNLHMPTHTGERPYACPFEGCNKTFIQFAHVQSHTPTHTKEKPYACTIEGCNKSFAQPSYLKSHINTHTGEKPHLCTVKGCDKSFSDRSNRNKHSKTCAKKKVHPCPVEGCNESFTSKQKLTEHEQTHIKNYFVFTHKKQACKK